MKNIILLSPIFISFIIQIYSLDVEKIRSDILTNHNYHRKRHQVDELERNSEIEQVAQSYSEYLASIETMKHSGNGKYGENLYNCWSSNGICITGEKASQMWYDEVKQYNFNNPGFSGGTGHFTQLVWKGSKQIGCGVACSINNKCYVTCNYYPPGNVLSQFDKNVFPLAGMSTAGKVFLAIFIIIIILLIAFSVFHFAYKKRKFSDIKYYFVKKKY